MTAFTAPHKGKITVQSFFGPRIVDGKPGFHPGIDITGNDPTAPLYSMHSGTVAAKWSYKSGTQNILVVSDDGTGILYSGLSEYNEIPVGSPVVAGDEIGLAGNTDAGRYHTHIEVVTPQGVARMGLTRGQDAGGNSVWLFNGKSLGDSTNAEVGQQYNLATRTGLPNNIKGDAYRQDVLIPGDVVVPWAQVSPNASAQLPQINKWSRATWDAANQLHPYLAETHRANQLFSAANFQRIKYGTTLRLQNV
jgi:peptidase M23-like protein